MLIRFVYLILLVFTSAALLYGSLWMFGEEVLKFGAAVGVLIKSFFVQLSKLTVAGVVKYIGAHFVRFFTIEWWKFFVVKYLKGIIIPFVFGTVIGARLSKWLDRQAYRTRKYRVLFKRWYRKQSKFVQIVFWGFSGVIILVLTIQVIGLGVLATAVKLPIWAYKFLVTAALKIWGIIQRIIFRTLMFVFTRVFVWKRAQRYLIERHQERMERLSARLDSHKQKVVHRSKKIVGKVIPPKKGFDESSNMLLSKSPKSSKDEALHLELLLRGHATRKKK